MSDERRRDDDRSTETEAMWCERCGTNVSLRVRRRGSLFVACGCGALRDVRVREALPERWTADKMSRVTVEVDSEVADELSQGEINRIARRAILDELQGDEDDDE